MKKRAIPTAALMTMATVASASSYNGNGNCSWGSSNGNLNGNLNSGSHNGNCNGGSVNGNGNGNK